MSFSAELGVGDLAHAAAAVVDGGAPLRVVEVVDADGVLGGVEYARGVGEAAPGGGPAEAEEAGGAWGCVDGADDLESGRAGGCPGGCW